MIGAGILRKHIMNPAEQPGLLKLLTDCQYNLLLVKPVIRPEVSREVNGKRDIALGNRGVAYQISGSTIRAITGRNRHAAAHCQPAKNPNL